MPCSSRDFGGTHLQNLAFDIKLVSGPHRLWPPELIEPDAHDAAGGFEFAPNERPQNKRGTSGLWTAAIQRAAPELSPRVAITPDRQRHGKFAAIPIRDNGYSRSSTTRDRNSDVDQGRATTSANFTQATSRKVTMRVRSLAITASLASGVVLTAMLAQPAPASAQQKCYPPEYTKSGELILPKNFHEWIFVGSPLTPNALNPPKANFPEYHNVYIEPCAYEAYQKTGVFPQGTIFFKELQLTLPPAENPDGSRTEPSGRGFFGGPFNGADVTVKDSKRFADTNGWGYFNFHHYEPKAKTATVRAKAECAYCHIASAKKDEVWTQFYPLLDK